MRKYIYQFIIGAMAAFSLSACSSDFLDTHPTDSTGTGSVFATTENIKMAVNGIAYLICTNHTAWGRTFAGEARIRSHYGEYPSQEFRYNGFAPGWASIMNGTTYDDTSTGFSSYPWGYYYEIISNANAIIAHVDEAEGAASEKSFYKAEALTFRAYSYVKLLELYSLRWQDTNDGATEGVVLRLDESTGSMPRSTVAQCYQQIYADLSEAVTLFTASGLDRASGEVWLPNINVAYAVYARAALNRQDYATALSMARLARTGYPLMDNADYVAGFCRPSGEWIFGSYGDLTEDQAMNSFGAQFSCNGYYATNTTYGAGAIEKELSDRIPVNDVRLSLFLTADKFPGVDLYQDNRMDLESGLINGEAEAATARNYLDSMTPSGLTAAYARAGYYLGGQLKFWVFDLPGVSYLCFIRSSEMLLIEAEANYFLGNTTAAQEALIELNATSGRNPSYTCTKTGTDLFEEIVDYRELELWGEGFNWYDLKRWNRGIDRKSFAEGGNCHSATATVITANSSTWTLSVPQTETDYE